MLRCFIGYDPNETVAYHVLAHSIMTRASQPVSITGLEKRSLEYCGYLHRETDPKQSTEFAFSRFLVPYLCNWEGYAIFMDCDMLCLSDIWELYQYAWHLPQKAVYVVKHDYVPKLKRKHMDHEQTVYPCKNWSSVMVFNNQLCGKLTGRNVNAMTGLELHQFKWLEDDSLIGELPRQWNHLVGEYAYDREAKLLHFTNGGPWWENTRNCDYAAQWMIEYQRMVYVNKWPKAFDSSVSAFHAKEKEYAA
jgi:lipopolysaccharide biosynthesis glycosyltransferase